MSDEDYWLRIGEENPWWGVLSHDRFRGADLDRADKEAFFAEGARDIAFAVAGIARHVDGHFAPRNALDFGCGVGRLTIAMRPHAQSVTGIDISPAMLARAEVEAKARGLSNVHFAREIPDGRFDWINSFIVFQHIEPAQGIALLESLLCHLAPNGFVSLHFSIFRDRRIWDRGVEAMDYGRYDGCRLHQYWRASASEMPIYEYDLSEVLCRFVAHGIESVALRHTDHSGLHGVWIFGRQGH